MNRIKYAYFSTLIISLFFLFTLCNHNEVNASPAFESKSDFSKAKIETDSTIIHFLESKLPDTFYCTGDTLVLYAHMTSADYLWSNATTTPFIEVWNPGMYWLEMTINDCVYRDSFYVNEIENCNQPFLCDGSFYMSISSENATTLYTLQVGDTVGFTQISSSAINYNAISFRASDRFIYAKGPYSHSLYKIGISGYADYLGQLPGLADGDWYIAGDFSPEDYYVVTSNNGGDKIAVYDLSSSQPELVAINDKTYTGSEYGIANFGDIAFHPNTGVCYAYDHNTLKLCTIDPLSGIVNPFGEQQSAGIDAIGALFFNAKGELFAYGRDEFFSIDLTTGAFSLLANGPMSSTLDACSCPYNVLFSKEVQALDVCADDLLEYTFDILNNSGQVQSNITFSDSLPNGFYFASDPLYTYGGQIKDGSAIGNNKLQITGMDIPPGLSSFVIEVGMSDDVLSQTVSNQATLAGFDSFLPYQIVSDDPKTYHFEDPTVSSVWNNSVAINTGFSDSILIVEYGDSVLVEPIFNFTPDTFYWADWSGQALSNCPVLCEEVWLSPTETTAFNITAMDEYGCEAFAEIRVEVDFNVDVFVPSAFSPNGDGVNDLFTVYAKEGKLQVRDFQVFSRWGSLVFQAKDFSPNSAIGWNGTVDGKEMNSSVFVWLAEVEYLDGRVELLKGDVTLFK